MKQFLAIVLSLIVLVMILQGSAKQDIKAPVVTIEVVDEVVATKAFELKLVADEPVNYNIKYGDLDILEVAQHYNISLLAVAGYNDIEITATDGAGNKSEYKKQVYGIELLDLVVDAPDSVIAGQPISISSSWAESQVKASFISVSLNGEASPVFFLDNVARALSAISLGSESGEILVEVSLEDEYQRKVSVAKTITVLADSNKVQELNLSPETLSLVTEDARAKERLMLEHVYSASKESTLALWNSSFILPIAGYGTSGFGIPRRYVRGGNVSYHRGEDLGAATGTKIAATNDGIVLAADFFAIKGGFVAIDHGAGVLSFYFHQSKLLVEAGQKVSKGEIIGEVGSTGLSTGPHLHWEMRVHGIATDPMMWVGKLLP